MKLQRVVFGNAMSVWDMALTVRAPVQTPLFREAL